MKSVVIDFETFYSKEYSLRKMTFVEYILDPRFECIGVAVKEDGGVTRWMTPDQLRGYLKTLPRKVMVLSHNANFDMAVLAWRFNYVPYLMIDTLGMARAMVGHKVRSLSLAVLATFFGIGTKGTTVHKVEGMGLQAIKDAGFYEEYAEYSKSDADLCWELYLLFMKMGFPTRELVLMDTVIRCAVLPRFELDRTVLAEHLNAVQAIKEALLARISFSKDDLMSNDKFAEALRSLGVEPPTKISMTTGKEAYAFAKTDQDFIDLEEHENSEVQALVSARLGVKSTIEETRTERFISIANLTWPGNRSALMPMPLRFSGAHTHRLSGDAGLNMQNLPRGGALRRSLKAPKGCVVMSVDASQIEARVAGWFCGATELVTAFAAHEDVYSSFAGDVFGYQVNKKEYPVERFVGKTGVLGLQYGLGWPSFQNTVALQSKSQVGHEVLLSDVDAARVVSTYRGKYWQIPAMWNTFNGLIPRMTGALHMQMGPVVFHRERIELPNGLCLHYHELQHEDGEWRFKYGRRSKRIYGGAMLENITQALARIIVMDAAVRIRQTTGKCFALQVHDELVFVEKEDRAQDLMDYVIEEFRKPPSWGLEIPLDAEGIIGANFGECK